mgnify:FL=1|tara:strand:- start:63 stop:512 length:450 start_codon:yes stop_codon:yes gene_type:complete
MSRETICEKERTKIEKLNKFQFHNKFKKVGYYIAFIAFGLMIAKKFVDEPEWVKPLLSGILLLGMLIISMSKDTIEDEYIDSLRSQSYRFSFVIVVLYSLIQPLINYGVGILFDETETLKGFDYFQVLFFMLVVQLMSFYQLKRVSKLG